MFDNLLSYPKVYLALNSDYAIAFKVFTWLRVTYSWPLTKFSLPTFIRASSSEVPCNFCTVTGQLTVQGNIRRSTVPYPLVPWNGCKRKVLSHQKNPYFILGFQSHHHKILFHTESGNSPFLICSFRRTGYFDLLITPNAPLTNPYGYNIIRLNTPRDSRANFTVLNKPQQIFMSFETTLFGGVVPWVATSFI